MDTLNKSPYKTLLSSNTLTMPFLLPYLLLWCGVGPINVIYLMVYHRISLKFFENHEFCEFYSPQMSALLYLSSWNCQCVPNVHFVIAMLLVQQ